MSHFWGSVQSAAIDRNSGTFGNTFGSGSIPWLVRLDHYLSDRHRFSGRYTFESRTILPGDAPTSVTFPGFVQQDGTTHHNLVFADSYTFGPSYTNEFRFAYGRPDSRFGVNWPGSNPLVETLPLINIAGVAAPGITSSNRQFHFGNSFLLQETQTKLSGRHAFRYGAELLRQLMTQARGGNQLGMVAFRNAPALGYTAFANYLDDFSGPSANMTRTFGAPVLEPNQFHQSYFLQDDWKATPALTFTAGVRYENFGQPANVLTYPAFAGFDPAQLLVHQEVRGDDNNFGPAFGFAWSPGPRSGFFRTLFGDAKTVGRGGYQISYDALFTQAIFLGPASTTPNAISTSTTAPATGRGLGDWMGRLPGAADAPRASDNEVAMDKDLRSPYTERWSFGFQRQLPHDLLLDISYIGSAGHKLLTKAEWNPLLNGQRLYPNLGGRDIRTSQGNSAYHALQARSDRRFGHGYQLAASYTWSKFVDSTSEGAGNQNLQDADKQNRTSVAVSQGGLKLDRGPSDFDRTHRLTIVYLWAIPGPRSGRWKHALGGWSIAGITTFQSGTPFSVANGTDRNNDGIVADRPDIGNAKAPIASRAVIFPGCSSGYRNPDTGLCTSPTDVHWVEGIGFPNPSTVGRNTLRTGGTNNFDLNFTKSVAFHERGHIEFRCEALNAFNHPQFVQVPQMSVSGTPAGRFLNRDFTDSGIRSIWVQVKVLF